MSEKITLADQIYADIKKDITNKQLVSGEKSISKNWQENMASATRL